MALQSTITYLCPQGDFSSGMDAVKALSTWRGVPFSSLDIEAKTNATQYYSQPTEFTWDNQTKQLQIIQTYIDQSAYDNYLSVFLAYIAGHVDPVLGPMAPWQLVSRTTATV
jgi:hypothetical protein